MTIAKTQQALLDAVNKLSDDVATQTPEARAKALDDIECLAFAVDVAARDDPNMAAIGAETDAQVKTANEIVEAWNLNGGLGGVLGGAPSRVRKKADDRF